MASHLMDRCDTRKSSPRVLLKTVATRRMKVAKQLVTLLIVSVVVAVSGVGEAAGNAKSTPREPQHPGVVSRTVEVDNAGRVSDNSVKSLSSSPSSSSHSGPGELLESVMQPPAEEPVLDPFQLQASRPISLFEEIVFGDDEEHR